MRAPTPVDHVKVLSISQLNYLKKNEKSTTKSVALSPTTEVLGFPGSPDFNF
jgi:hypothetical protein